MFVSLSVNEREKYKEKKIYRKVYVRNIKENEKKRNSFNKRRVEYDKKSQFIYQDYVYLKGRSEDRHVEIKRKKEKKTSKNVYV